MRLFFLISCVITAVTGMFTVTRQAHMLQQNSYFPSRYLNWLRSSFSFKSAVFCGVLFAEILLFVLKLYVPLFILSILSLPLCAYGAVNGQKKAIKKLVFTARVKRQYFSLFIIYAVLCLLAAFVSDAFFIAIAALCFLPCVSVLLVRTLNTPAEKAVTHYYINDAKRILKQHGDLTVIGVTGSYGKTSTKYILASLLEQKYNVVYTPASFNTPMGVVRTIRESIRPETQIFIAEMGAKNIGDIKEICDIVNPHIGIITSVGPQHLDTFKSIDNVLSTKFELTDSVLSTGGKVFLNNDNEYINKKATAISCVTYGKSADVSYSNVSYGEDGASFTINGYNEIVNIKTKLLGMHNVQNLAGAASVALYLGVNPSDIAYAAAKLKPVEHRLQLKTFLRGALLIDDAYNANPEGSLEAVRVLGSMAGRRKVIVTPGLIELGEREYECNFALGEAAAGVCDEIILVGKKRSEPLLDGVKKADYKGKISVVASFAEALEKLKATADNNTAVLIENDLPDNYLK